MLSIVWHLMYPSVIKLLQDHLITQQKYGILLLENNYAHLLVIQAKLLQYHLILMEFLSEQVQWIAQPNYGMSKWVKSTQLLKVMKDNLYPYILTHKVT